MDKYVYDIVWDTGGKNPKKLCLPLGIEIKDNFLSDEQLSAALSAQYGWPVKSLKLREGKA